MSTLEITAIVISLTGAIVFAIVKWPPEVPLGLGISLFALGALAAIAGREETANQLSLGAFYALGWGVALLIIEHIRDHWRQT